MAFSTTLRSLPPIFATASMKALGSSIFRRIDHAYIFQERGGKEREKVDDDNNYDDEEGEQE